MGEAALVEGQIADAIALVKKLDARGDAPTLAVWYLYDDANEWRLLVAGPTFDAVLQKQEPIAYQKIVEAIADTKPTSLAVSDVKLIGSKTALPGAIRMMIGTGPTGIARAHCIANTINGIFIKEMIVIRSA
jgi:hypothetical protein